MAKGGARARSGPAPDPNALRRDRKNDGEWVELPAEGRDGPTPQWPLDQASTRELDLWSGEWERPQALMWEINGQDVEVALYVRSLVAAEQLDAPVAARTLVRQQQEALGISVPGLHRNRWRISGATPTPRKQESTSGQSSIRDRLKVVQGGGD